MPFFTSPGQEVDEHRLKRSNSLTSVRTRTRQASGSTKPPPPSHIHTHATITLLPASDDVLAPYLPSIIPPPIPDQVPATSPNVNLNQSDHDSPKLPQGSVPGEASSHHCEDSSPLRVPSSVHEPELGQRPDTSSALPSPSNFGSLSDSGVASRAPRSPRVHLSPPSTRHHSPSSPILPIAGYFSDGDRSPSFLHPSRLDLKSLLSKPAAPSVNSTLSITSDSESNALPRVHSNSNEAWPRKTKMQVHFQPSSTLPTESTEQLPTSPQPSLQQRPRNLLRKRSGSKQARAAVSTTLPGKTTASQPTFRSSAAASPRSEFSTTLQFVIASRATVPASAPSLASSRKLTPAGAIAQAYKEQDLHREALAAAARAETPVPASGKRLGVLDTDASVSSESFPEPFVIVDSVEDARSGSHSASASASTSAVQPIKSLTRKVSARFRRGKPSVSRDDGTQSAHGDGGDGEHGQLPLCEDPPSRHHRKRSSSFPKIRLSLDQRNPSGSSLDGRGHPPMPSESIPDSPALNKGKQKLREDDTGAGGRLWRLVKRISAAGLRERFLTTGEPVPPVPTIPSDLAPSTAKMPITPNSASGFGGPEPGGATSAHSMDPRPSMSAVRTNVEGRMSMTCTPPEIPSTPQGPSTTSQPRHPSISSSSPQSSEPMSTHFFRSHSSRSSFSSIFSSSPPPPPLSGLPQSPGPRTRSRVKSISSPPVTATRPSFDEPPPKSPRVRTRKRSSPEVPSFSVSEVVNNFIARRPSLVRHASNSRRQNAPAQSTTEETNTPPPRPARSELRKAAAVNPMLSPGPSVLSNDSHSSSSTERGGSTSASTISAHAVAGTSASAGSVARMTFREIGGSQRQAWTSQEKEDKWDDLLEKSARAGGTLHLGGEGAGLPSDNLRFSLSTLELESQSQI